AGVTVNGTQGAMKALGRGYREQRPETADNSWASILVPAPEDATGNLRPAFVTLLLAVSAVLLIACTNVANLLLVRFTGRRREIALRMALGAGSGGMVRLLVLKGLLLGALAGVLVVCL